MMVKPIVFVNGRNRPCIVILEEEHDSLVLFLRTARVGVIITPREGGKILVEFPGMTATAVSQLVDKLMNARMHVTV